MGGRGVLGRGGGWTTLDKLIEMLSTLGGCSSPRRAASTAKRLECVCVECTSHQIPHNVEWIFSLFIIVSMPPPPPPPPPKKKQTKKQTNLGTVWQ